MRTELQLRLMRVYLRLGGALDLTKSTDFPVAQFVEEVKDIWGVSFSPGPLVRAFKTRDWDVLFWVVATVNDLAKESDNTWYRWKNQLLHLALKEKPQGLRYCQGVLYAETSAGQVSFHIYERLWSRAAKLLGEEETNPWVGVRRQTLSAKVLAGMLGGSVAADKLQAMAKSVLAMATRVAEVSAADYLKGLNLEALRKNNKPTSNPKEFYLNLQQQAAEGPLFSAKTLKTIADLTVRLEKPEAKWLGNQLQTKNIKLDNLPSVLEWIRTTKHSVEGLDYSTAKGISEHWHSYTPPKSLAPVLPSKVNIENLVLKFDDGYYFIKLSSRRDCVEEGHSMGHCVGKKTSYWRGMKDGEIAVYSLRDSKNNPHVTIEVDLEERKVHQIQGKADTVPVPKYHKYITALVNKERLRWDSTTIPYAPDSILEMLSTGFISERAAAALSPKLPPSVLRRLADDEEISVVIAVAQNPNIPKDVQLKLSTNSHDTVRLNIAHLTSDPDLLYSLSSDDNMYVRSGVADNNSSDVKTLSNLIDDPTDYVRQSVAHNPNTPLELLAKLAKDSNSSVQAAVAKNPNTTDESLLLHLFERTNSAHVLAAVANNPYSPPKLVSIVVRHKDPEVRSWLAETTNLKEIIAALAKDTDVNVRAAVAGNAHTDSETLDLLATDEDAFTRITVADNQNTSTKTLDLLATDENEAVRDAVIGHRNLNPATLDKLLGDK